MSEERAILPSRAKREEGPRWRGFVLLMTAGGTKHARVSIPESVMRAYLVGEVQPPDMRGIVVAKIETELAGDKFVEGRGW